MNWKYIENYIFTVRSVFPLPFYIICLLFGQFDLIFFGIGIVLILTGEIIRFYSVGFIGKTSRTIDKPVAKELIIHGPYQWVRNPIYIGNSLIYLGFTVLSNVFLPYFPLIALLIFILNYSVIIRFEEKYLLARFGGPYRSYCHDVNRWLPAFRNRIPGNRKFHFQTAWQSEKPTLLVLLPALLIITIRMTAGRF